MIDMINNHKKNLAHYENIFQKHSYEYSYEFL